MPTHPRALRETGKSIGIDATLLSSNSPKFKYVRLVSNPISVGMGPVRVFESGNNIV
jgi:hypothetical protein